MILDEILQEIETGLNENTKGYTFKIFSNLGDYKDAYRVVNTIESNVYGIGRNLPIELLPLANVNMYRMNVEIEFAINVDTAQIDDDGNYVDLDEIIDIINNYASTSNAVPFTVTTTTETYQVLPVFTLPNVSDSVVMETSDLGEIIPVSFSVDCLITEGLVNSNSYQLVIDGNNINFEGLTFTKQRTANQYTYRGSSNTKTNIIQSAIGIDVTMPQFLNEGNDIIVKDLIGDKNNTIHTVDLTVPLSDGNSVQRYYMTFGNGNITVQKGSNVGLNFSLVEYPAKSLQDTPWVEIAKISESGIANQVFRVGDTKEFFVGNKKYTAFILDFNHDLRVSDTGYEKRAGITFGVQEAQGSSPFFASLTNEGGWYSSTIMKDLMELLFNSLPNEMKQVIKEVVIESLVDDTMYTSTVEKLFLPSCTEIFGGRPIVGFVPNKEGYQYAYYKDKNVDLDTNTDVAIKEKDGEATIYWTRTPAYQSTTEMYAVNTFGEPTSRAANSQRAVSYIFCI